MQSSSCTPQQGFPDQISSLPARRRNHLKRFGIGAPDEFAALTYLSPKEILILSGSEFRPEWCSLRTYNLSFKKHIASPRLSPVYRHSGWIHAAHIKPAFPQPCRRGLIKMAQHRSQHPVDLVLNTDLEQ